MKTIKLNFFHFVSMFWLIMGLIALYFMTMHFSKELALRLYGEETVAKVIGTNQAYVSGTGQRMPHMSEKDYYRMKDQNSKSVRITYSLNYQFQLSKGKIIKGKATSSFPFDNIRETVRIKYLPYKPMVSMLSKRTQNNFGNNFFWIIGFIFWLVLFPGLSLRISKLGRPRKTNNK